jgi:hypothetical protein
MRESAQAPGMPRWQAAVIRALADVAEGIDQLLAPVLGTFRDWWQKFMEWLQSHLAQGVLALSVLLLFALLIALWHFQREAQIGIWLQTRVEFMRYAFFGLHAPGREGAAQYYRAMERLFELQDQARPPTANAREYLLQLSRMCRDGRPELIELTSLFEHARYGRVPPAQDQLDRMRKAYRKLFLITD